MNGAKIGGQLSCDKAIFDCANGTALNAESFYVGESLFLSGVKAKGTVAVNGAKIGLQLNCEGATIEGTVTNGKCGTALQAQGVVVADSLFLSCVKATGTVNVNGAKIGGQLACVGATFDGAGGTALQAQRVKVTEALIWRGVTVKSGAVSLAAAHVGDLWDDVGNWPDDLILDGFTYDRLFDSDTSTSARDRLPWLAKGSVFNGTFSPQPYTQQAKVLREMGHDRGARLVLLEREKLLARHQYADQKKEYDAALHGDQSSRADAGKIWLSMMGARGWASLTRRITGYGYAPQKALYWAFACVAVGTVVYFIGYAQGWMVPNSPIILTSADWATAYGADAIYPALKWQGQAAAHYETFFAIPYALDVFLPVVDLGQHAAWTQTTATYWGVGLRVFTWALQGAGYLITGLGLAAATGIIQKDRG